MESTAPRKRATRHHSDKTSAGATIDTVGEGGVLPNKRLEGDRVGEGEAVVIGSGDVVENTLGLFPMMASGGAHVKIEKADIG